jgi:hypothetical protein
MRILIENAETLQYLTADGAWTKEPNAAATYRTSTVAKEHGKTAPIGRFNVIGAFKNSPQITNLDDGCGTATH